MDPVNRGIRPARRSPRSQPAWRNTGSSSSCTCSIYSSPTRALRRLFQPYLQPDARQRIGIIYTALRCQRNRVKHESLGQFLESRAMETESHQSSKLVFEWNVVPFIVGRTLFPWYLRFIHVATHRDPIPNIPTKSQRLSPVQYLSVGRRVPFPICYHDARPVPSRFVVRSQWFR